MAPTDWRQQRLAEVGASWEAWVRQLPGLTPTAQLVAFEIARLADTRGVAIVPIQHLIDTTARSRRGILAAIRTLETRGYLRREKRRAANARFQTNRIQLIRAAVPAAETPSIPPQPVDQHVPGQVSASNEYLRSLLQTAVANEWRGQAATDLAATIAEVGPGKFGAIILKRRLRGAALDPWDTLTLAWEIAQAEASSLIEAREPWALWVYLVDRAGGGQDAQACPSLPLDQCPPQEGPPEAETTPIVLGIDDFDSRLIRIVFVLVESGLSEAIAWAGTARLLELIDAGASRRHWLAGRDSKLQGLGIDAGAARAWMTLLVGSRRGRQGVLNSTTEPDIHKQAQSVIRKLRGTSH